MIKGKFYLIQIPDGQQIVARLIGIENGFYNLKFEKCNLKAYSNRTKNLSTSRFESGVACMEGTDYLVIKEIK